MPLWISMRVPALMCKWKGRMNLMTPSKTKQLYPPGLAPPHEIGGEITIDGVAIEKGFVITPEWMDRNMDVICQYMDLFISYPD